MDLLTPLLNDPGRYNILQRYVQFTNDLLANLRKGNV